MSPNQLIPSQPFTLSYFITDHTDSNTYYVRAVIYDATDGEVLGTHNLTQQTTNSRLFSKRTNAPGDSSGKGRRIVVVATAYTDSGYTTKSDIYQEQSENYIITNPATALGGLGAGGGYIDYNIIKEIIETEVLKLNKVLEKVYESLDKVAEVVGGLPTETPNLEPIVTALASLSEAVAKIPTEAVNITPVIEKVQEAIQAIADKDVTDATDIAPLTEALADLKEVIETNHSEHKDTLGAHMADLNTVLPSVIHENTVKALGEADFGLNMPFKMNFNKKESKDEEKKPEKPRVDISKLL